MNTLTYNSSVFDIYPQISSYRLNYPDENVIRFLVSNFPANNRKNKKILDLGSGLGRHLILLNEFSFKGFGIDGSPYAVEFTKMLLKKKKIKSNLELGLITNLPYKDNFFDGIIEHATLVNNSWSDILKTCNECFRVLKKDGVAFFLLKNIKDCAFLNAQKVGKNEYLVKDEVYISRKTGSKNLNLLFHAFTIGEIKQMFSIYSKVQIHTWNLSFKSLNINDFPGDRQTSYYIV